MLTKNIKIILLFALILTCAFLVWHMRGNIDAWGVDTATTEGARPATALENAQALASSHNVGCDVPIDDSFSIYINNKYHYGIDYPKKWACREFPDTANGAGFTPDAAVSTPYTEVMSIAEEGRATDDCSIPFSEYVKDIAIKNIQGFEKLNSIEKVTTQTGSIGYKTTWIYTDLMGQRHTSPPMTYFEDKGQTECNNQVGYVVFTLADSKYLDQYNTMLNTINVSQAVPLVAKHASIQGKPLATYTNTELGFSFSYPAELGSVDIAFDTDPARKGNGFYGNFPNANSEVEYGFGFGSSSPDYVPNPNMGRDMGIPDLTRTLDSFKSDDYTVVSDISGNGVSGKLISGTDKCVDMCFFALGNNEAIFPIPKNDKGISVVGISSDMNKDDFINLMKSFKILK